jgi:hypothetical protein
MYSAWEREDFGWEELLAPDAKVDLTAIYPERPLLRSASEALDFVRAAWGSSQRFEPERYFDVDDERVLVLVRATATGQTAGATVALRPAHELTIRDGLVVRLKAHPDHATALRALGVSR